MDETGGAGGGTREAVRAYDPEASFQLLGDPVAQWLDWEEQANLIGFRVSTVPVEVALSKIDRDALEVFVLPGAPDEIVKRFVRGRTVLCARHPLNRDPSVAWQTTPVAERWSARFTSSRTLAMFGPESGAGLFSLKLATDHPHPDFLQPEKTKLRSEAMDAVRWAFHLERIDRLLPPLEGARLIPEILVVLERGGETGFMVRDLRFFQDGNYSLPALSLPFVGRQLARAAGSSFASFWKTHYAEAVGRGKARLLLRYGLIFETPNPQNLLVRFDAGLRPIPGVVFRDVGDGDCATDANESPTRPWSRLVSDIRPETKNSFWAFGEAGEHSVDAATLESWYAAHDDAYYGELEATLPELAPPPELAPAARLDHWNQILRTARGEEVVAACFDRAMARAAELRAAGASKGKKRSRPS
ncbi:MAG: ferric iron reductase [Myxococcota bacterium]